MYLNRTVIETLSQASKYFKVVLLTGPRQVGKTTCLEHLLTPDRSHVNLDDVEDLIMAQNDPVSFFKKYPPPVLIDEVQRAPNLFIYIKRLADKSTKKGQFWLTGSHQFHLMKNVSESLAGRVAVVEMQGLTQSERVKDYARPAFRPDLPLHTKRPTFSAMELFQIIHEGAFPQLQDHTPQQLFHRSYINTYLERDVREILQVAKEQEFVKFLRILAARTAQVLNYHSMANIVGVNTNTIKNWVSVLETSGLIYLLQPYYSNLAKRVTKTPKLYFLDTGLCCYLCRISSAKQAQTHNMSGALLETYAVSEILKSYWHNGQAPNTYFYRDTMGKEIDLLIEEDGKIYPIEIKQTASPHPRMASNFDIIPKSKRGTGAILSLTDKFTPMGSQINSIPISYI